MIIKQREEPVELKYLRLLNSRLSLSEEKKAAFWSIVKGFKGEEAFDELSGQLFDNYLVVNDLFLKHNNTFFQLDTLIIAADTIYLFEIKNYEGDYLIENDLWYSIPKTEIKNPLLQLARSESLFRQLISDLGFSHSIKSYLVFINPQFTLYQVPLNMPIIFPTQLKRFFENLKINKKKINDRHFKLAYLLQSCHVRDNYPLQIPNYNYNELLKGMSCNTCHSIINKETDRTVECGKCGRSEKIEDAILRSIEEFSFLFPDKKITTNTIYDWCKTIKSKKTIRKVLSKHFILHGHMHSSYYVKRQD